jgi:hypothetical protein
MRTLKNLLRISEDLRVTHRLVADSHVNLSLIWRDVNSPFPFALRPHPKLTNKDSLRMLELWNYFVSVLEFMIWRCHEDALSTWQGDFHVTDTTECFRVFYFYSPLIPIKCDLFDDSLGTGR